MKKYLFVMRRLPHLTSHVQEALDQMLTTAAFDQSVSVLLLDDGVFQLKAGQNPQNMALKNTAAIFTALALYEIKDVFAEAESLADRGLGTDDLILPVQSIPRAAVNELMRRHDVIVPD
ncbi:sulfurtransferase complex subunit TusC [Methylomonas rivi]|uniref:Sulfurtransferase complex subunit TusC n=1 Tax=Methylomonas rivi TaxID=2952226 RepID=A0ABT1U103_9GAMM|nr:sulfurtransferase complex subunit TusC [Methylomonas sp. WSC-6]MBS4052489.1 sulfurtransferase complex subunit TusC [Methylomonas sp.]MCQ8127498.1 sulfurtransferase complex subunit TusC [Methylomonas sp. WSC-6]